MPGRFVGSAATWQGVTGIGAYTFDCAYCGDRVNSSSGCILLTPPHNQVSAYVRICPGCNGPNVFGPNERRYPGIAYGEAVPNLPDELTRLYEEARDSASVGAFTASVLVCRKMLMNIAVREGAEEGKPFVSYVEYLSEKGFVPPNGKGWVDYIRTRGNEATHEIELMQQADARALIRLVEMLLRFIYEFPAMIPVPPPSTTAPGG